MEPAAHAEDDGSVDEYSQIAYDVFDKFVRQRLAKEADNYQTLEDIDERLQEEAQNDLDLLYAKLKAEGNPLQVIKKRRPSVYDEYRQEREKKIAEHLSDIE